MVPLLTLLPDIHRAAKVIFLKHYTFVHINSLLIILQPLSTTWKIKISALLHSLQALLVWFLYSPPLILSLLTSLLSHWASCSSWRKKKNSLCYLQTASLSGTPAPMLLCDSFPYFIWISIQCHLLRKVFPRTLPSHSVTPSSPIALFMGLVII